MNIFFIIYFLCLSVFANAKTYYFSTTSGDDNRTSDQAQNSSTPWKTINKLNSFFDNINPGDNILFMRGNIFTGSIIVTKDGLPANPISIGAYGSGSKPVISGFTNVYNWNNLGNNIWESNDAVSSFSELNMVVINSVNTAMGRYPNSGYLTYQSHTGNSSITSSSINSSITNWTGAEVVIRMNRWVLDRNKINTHSGSTFTYTDNLGDYLPSNNFGFFIQNDARTLDTINEWYFNPSTKKLRIFSNTYPSEIKIAGIKNLVDISQRNFVTINNISFEGANENSINISTGTHFILNSCEINYSGVNAVNAYPNSPFIKIENCIINNSNNAALFLGSADNVIVTNNSINNTGVFAGMGRHINSSFEAIGNSGNNANISYNSIINTGYCGIKYDGDATIVNNNFINNYCFVKDDGGGIYTFPLTAPRVYIKRIVKNNIVMNSPGAALGTSSTESSGHGIYQDGAASNVDYKGNTIANCLLGLYLHGSHETKIESNTIYNCNRGLVIIKYDQAPLDNISSKHNIFVSRTATQYPVYFEPMATTMPASFISDSNYYARPISDGTTIWMDKNGTNYFYTLADWKTVSGKDLNSKKSPQSIASVYNLRYEYNETTNIRTVNLGSSYIDMKGILYPGTISLQPYSSAVLIKIDTANIPPVAEAGANQTIIIPVSNVNISGYGIDHDGIISTYNWKKISGPTAGNLLTTTSPSTSVIGLVGGIYKFELKVTDDKGAIGKDTVTIIYQAFLVPTSLLDFSVSEKFGKSLLQWATATEINSSHFELERSTDGRNFEKLSTIGARGNTNTRIEYQLFDYFPETGINYYRLKIFDKNGQFKYSKIISIIFKNTNSGSIDIKSVFIKNNKLKLNLSSSKIQLVTITLYDAIGRELIGSSIVLQKGMNTINKTVLQPVAVYYFKLKSNEETKAMSLFFEK